MDDKPLTHVLARMLERVLHVPLTHEGRAAQGREVVEEMLDRTRQIRKGQRDR